MDHVTTADGRLRVWETFRDTTPETLFGYWTEPYKLKVWWPSEVEVEPVSGGHYRYSFSQVGHTLTGTFSEVKPGQRLAFSWHWEHEPGVQQVVVDFEPRDKDTLLTVTHGPFGADEAGKSLRQDQLEGWTHFIEKLKAAVRQN